MTNFAPVRRKDGYLPIEDYGLIGDGSTAGLIGRDGALVWLCVPRFDSPAVFCSLLDTQRGGSFILAPEDLTESRQYYEQDSGVLVTEMRSKQGVVRVTDALTLHAGADLSEGTSAARGELLRSARVLEGRIRLKIHVEPRGGAAAERRGEGLSFACAGQPGLHLHLTSIPGINDSRATLELGPGDSAHFFLCWRGGAYRQQTASPEDILNQTRSAWNRWIEHFSYEGPQEPLVRRSAITLKLLDHFENGGIVAAPTSSLPEAIGGPRNWDYRYCWIRDAAFSVYALRRIGLVHEAASFLGWVLEAVETHGHPKVLYNLDGDDPEPEWEDRELEGYRRSTPVRWGNAAAEQKQHDVYGEILDCAYQWAAHEGRISKPLWARLRRLVESAAEQWRHPDHGIWEVRTPGRAFTYSAAMCQVALDRAARMAERFGLPGDINRWKAAAHEIQQALLEQAWDEARNSLTEHLGGGGIDASLLTLPLRRVVPAGHPKMVATTEAVVRRLGAGDGLLYRYLPNESPDGLPGHEGAFLLCSFWLVDNLAKQGRLQEAMDLYDSLCGRANSLGLLPEQIDPPSGAFLGNYPQAFSHVGVIASGVNLARLMKSPPPNSKG
jgi:GH15 family glucan-1,4-alpha-glucosidase